MKKMNAFLVYFWLILSVISIAIVIYFFATEGIKDNLLLLLLPVISIAMYVFRRNMRKRLDKYD
jgi:c-di-AMP phosphodiesterase-like protein